MDFVQALLLDGRKATQREVFYSLLARDSTGVVCSQGQLNETLLDVGALLRTTRSSLGIIAASRGHIYGPLAFRTQGSFSWIDCASASQALPGDASEIAEIRLASAFGVLIVEKYAIFQRLVEEGICAQVCYAAFSFSCWSARSHYGRYRLY